MTVLRVLAAAVPAEDHAESWALFDATGACVGSAGIRPQRGLAPIGSRWSLAAALTRIAVVALPPMSASRVASAARFALEDQLGGPVDAHHVAASAQTRDGRVRVAIASRPLLSSIAEDIPRSRASSAESDLAAPSADWRWCAREAGTAGFVRRPDGSAFPVDAPSPKGALPAALALALAQSRRGETTCACASTCRSPRPRSRLEPREWRRIRSRYAVAMESACPAAFASATDLLPPSSHASAPARRRALAPALAIARLALALHVVASAGDWASLRWHAFRAAEAWTSLAAAAGLAPEAATRPSRHEGACAAVRAISPRPRPLAPDDALPLLARAAPALAALPAGAVKSATYAERHWTPTWRSTMRALRELDARIARPACLVADRAVADGARMRFGGS